ncbi:hypothetical protein T11_8214 [Trichinella zimbabwensis]|uniref:Uncharacterized protein n=1 Tax=Trichinella zimbabwensis TaxID=268475 RepID=A0A0V1I566_9BILA|nr:hypothetical protein T11_8214 [Trichinella zimbabwensis]
MTGLGMIKLYWTKRRQQSKQLEQTDNFAVNNADGDDGGDGGGWCR